MAVHQILIDAAGGLVETGIEFVKMLGTHHRFGGDINHGLAIRGEFETLDAAFHGAEFLLFFGFHIHGKDVVVAAEKQRFVVFPNQVELAGCRNGKLAGFAAFSGNQVDFGIALILVHVIIGHDVGNLFTVRRNGFLIHLAQRPHHLRGETAVLDLNFGLADNFLIVLILFLHTATN